MNFANEVIKIGQPAEHTVEVPNIFNEPKPKEIKPEIIGEVKEIPSMDVDEKKLYKMLENYKTADHPIINALKREKANLNEFIEQNEETKNLIVSIILGLTAGGITAFSMMTLAKIINDIIREAKK